MLTYAVLGVVAGLVGGSMALLTDYDVATRNQPGGKKVFQRALRLALTTGAFFVALALVIGVVLQRSSP